MINESLNKAKIKTKIGKAGIFEKNYSCTH